MLTLAATQELVENMYLPEIGTSLESVRRVVAIAYAHGWRSCAGGMSPDRAFQVLPDGLADEIRRSIKGLSPS